MFQFRHGAIKTISFPPRTPLCVRFQFRHGAIKTRDVSYRRPSKRIVSIPTRCDQNPRVVRGRSSKCAFQFRHGAIKTILYRIGTHRSRWFQFRHGAIKTEFEMAKYLIVQKFQFRHGAIKTILYRIGTHRSRWFQFRHGAIKTFFFFLNFHFML